MFGNNPNMKLDPSEICFYFPINALTFHKAMLSKLQSEIGIAPWLPLALEKMSRAFGRMILPGSASEIAISALKVCKLFVISLPVEAMRQEESSINRILLIVASTFLNVGNSFEMKNSMIQDAHHAMNLVNFLKVFECLHQNYSLVRNAYIELLIESNVEKSVNMV